MNRKKIWWSLLIIWCLGIYTATELPVFTGERTEKIIEHSIQTKESEEQVNHELTSTINLAIRKSAHFIVFGVLALLFLKVLTPMRGKFIMAWLLTVIYAMTDEWHQLHVPNRSGSATDVMIDALGALFFLVIAAVWKKVCNSRSG